MNYLQARGIYSTCKLTQLSPCFLCILSISLLSIPFKPRPFTFTQHHLQLFMASLCLPSFVYPTKSLTHLCSANLFSSFKLFHPFYLSLFFLTISLFLQTAKAFYFFYLIFLMSLWYQLLVSVFSQCPVSRLDSLLARHVQF